MSRALHQLRHRKRGPGRPKGSRCNDVCRRKGRLQESRGQYRSRGDKSPTFDRQLSLRIDRMHDMLHNLGRYPAWPPCRHAQLRLVLRALEWGIPA